MRVSAIPSAEAIVARRRLRSVPAALMVLAEYVAGADGRRLRSLAEEMLAGGDLSDSPTLRRLDAPTQRLIRTGIQTGSLVGLLRAAVALASERRRNRSIALTGLLYPAVMLCGAALLQMLVLPLLATWREIFNDFGVELPTLFVFYVSLVDVWPLFAAALAASVVALLWCVLAPLHRTTRRWHQHLLRWIPGASRSVRHTAQAEVALLAAPLIEAKLPLPDALRTAGTLAETVGAQRLANRLAAGIESGDDLDAAFRRAELDDWARDALGDESPRELAAHLERRGARSLTLAALAIQLLLLWLTPAVIALVAAAIAFCASTLIIPFLPLIRLLNSLA